ncbi:MAG: hypothetical protein V4787_09255 [Pseudomonadota bacterium]
MHSHTLADPDWEIPRYSDSLDLRRLVQDYPPPPDYYRKVFRMSRDELRSLQERRFLATMDRGWQIPFFQRHWGKAGVAPGDIRGLDDLQRLPPYDVHDIRESIERVPPFGDFMGTSEADRMAAPHVIHTSGGTTGLPRPMFYTPQDREIMAILGARRWAMQGIRPGDLVLVSYSMGLGNSGHAHREQLWHYTGAIPVMAGSGAATPTRRQVELIRAWKIKALVGGAAYLRHMATVARDELGIDPRSLGIKMIGCGMGIEDRAAIEELWDAPVFDGYGTHESGAMAAECGHRDGMHINEDCFILETADPETGRMLGEGEHGTLYITTLYKQSAPQIRFNVNDISALQPGVCACGSTMRRLERIYGRNDNMIKLRGANVFPEAVGAVVAQDARTNGEFFIFVDQTGPAQTPEMDVWVEVADVGEAGLVRADLERRMREVLSVRVTVTPVARGELDRYTGTTRSSKIKRVLDKRKQPAESPT